jgi:hypothetical protein
MPRFYPNIVRPSANKAVTPVTETKAPPKNAQEPAPKDKKKNGTDGQ